jgi:NADH dehydrogenase (ubiquinone) 1 alpha subcomplex subunit 9
VGSLSHWAGLHAHSFQPPTLPSRPPVVVVVTVTATWAPLSPSSLRFRPSPTAATMQAAALRRQLLDLHLSPTSSSAIAALRSGSVPGLTPQGSYHLPQHACPSGWVDLSERVGLFAGLCGADGARYMASARAPAVKGSGHLVRKGTGGRSSVR